MIAHLQRRPDCKIEVIPVESKEFGIYVSGRSATAIALDKEGKEIGATKTRLSRGLVYVIPKEGAFSYLLTPSSLPKVALRCVRDRVVPGETVVVMSKKTASVSHTASCQT